MWVGVGGLGRGNGGGTAGETIHLTTWTQTQILKWRKYTMEPLFGALPYKMNFQKEAQGEKQPVEG